MRVSKAIENENSFTDTTPQIFVLLFLAGHSIANRPIAL